MSENIVFVTIWLILLILYTLTVLYYFMDLSGLTFLGKVKKGVNNGKTKKTI